LGKCRAFLRERVCRRRSEVIRLLSKRFRFRRVAEIRSPIFVGLRTGQSNIGFNAHDAYNLLKLSEYASPTGVKFLLNFDVDSTGDVDRFTKKAVG
jgi:hypothetical protein